MKRPTMPLLEIRNVTRGFGAPDARSIWLDGRDLADKPPEPRPVHTAFRSYALLPHMSVARNEDAV